MFIPTVGQNHRRQAYFIIKCWLSPVVEWDLRLLATTHPCKRVLYHRPLTWEKIKIQREVSTYAYHLHTILKLKEYYI